MINSGKTKIGILARLLERNSLLTIIEICKLIYTNHHCDTSLYFIVIEIQAYIYLLSLRKNASILLAIIMIHVQKVSMARKCHINLHTTDQPMVPRGSVKER